MAGTENVGSRQSPNEQLETRLAEAEEVLAAIRSNSVDAFLVEDSAGERVYTLHTADRINRHFLECMQEGALTLATDGSILFCNRRFADMVNAPRERFAGQNLLQHVSAESRPALHDLLRKAATATQRGELILQRADGGRTPIHFSLGAMDLDGTIAFWAIVTDVTQQKHYEELLRTQKALSESEEKLRLFIEHAPAAVAMFDRDMRYLAVSRRWLQDYKLSGSIIGRTHYEVFPHGPKQWRETHERCLAGAIEACDEERVQHPDGSIEWFRWEIRPWFDSAGRISGIVIFSEDITSQKQAEQERERLLAAERRARQEAEIANHVKDEFLATLSHELRTPLTAIIGWSQILRNPDVDSAMATRAVSIIENSARAQAKLIEDVLDVSRIVTGKLSIDFQPVQLALVIDAAVETVRPTADAKQVRIEVVLNSGSDSIQGDANRLQQALSNLLSNAVKFTSSGGFVQIRLERVASHVEIAVIDTGEGIDSEFLPHVFDRFRQADSTKARRHGGLGLGLAIVRHLVELHGGEVLADSPGKGYGSKFTLRFPLSNEAAGIRNEKGNVRQQPAVETRPAKSLPKGLHVLAIDDQADALEVIRTMLEQCGANVSVAGSAAAAVGVLENAFAEGKRPDVILSDIGMPDEDGIALLSRIRRMECARTIPAIALTAYAGPGDTEVALAAGYDLHVPKPFTEDALRKAIEEVIQNRWRRP